MKTKSRRAIELECYALVRATGREVQVTQKFTPRNGPVTWGCDDGREYAADELRRCSKEVYDQVERERLDAEMVEDFAEWKAEERADEQLARDLFLNSIRD